MIDAHYLYGLVILPTLFGMSLVGEGVYKMYRYETGWMDLLLGVVFLAGVAFGYFYMIGTVK